MNLGVMAIPQISKIQAWPSDAVLCHPQETFFCEIQSVYLKSCQQGVTFSISGPQIKELEIHLLIFF